MSDFSTDWAHLSVGDRVNLRAKRGDAVRRTTTVVSILPPTRADGRGIIGDDGESYRQWRWDLSPERVPGARTSAGRAPRVASPRAVAPKEAVPRVPRYRTSNARWSSLEVGQMVHLRPKRMQAGGYRHTSVARLLAPVRSDGVGFVGADGETYRRWWWDLVYDPADPDG